VSLTKTDNFFNKNKTYTGTFLFSGLTVGKFLVVNFEFGGLERDCCEVDGTPNLKLLVTFGVNLEGVCREFYT
jgi:hypothetical protein